MTKNKLVARINIDKVKELVGHFKSWPDPELVLEQVGENMKLYSKDYLTHDELYELNNKAMSLHEFDNGQLMTQSIPEKYITFAIDFLRQIQKQYNCQTPAEKALAELAAINFTRILDLNEKLEESLTIMRTQSAHHDSCLDAEDPFYASDPRRTACQRTVLELKLMTVLGKELDRANRHFLTAIQTLKAMKMPPMQVNIKTDTAVVGQNQIVQANHKEIYSEQ